MNNEWEQSRWWVWNDKYVDNTQIDCCFTPFIIVPSVILVLLSLYQRRINNQTGNIFFLKLKTSACSLSVSPLWLPHLLSVSFIHSDSTPSASVKSIKWSGVQMSVCPHTFISKNMIFGRPLSFMTSLKACRPLDLILDTLLRLCFVSEKSSLRRRWENVVCP